MQQFVLWYALVTLALLAVLGLVVGLQAVARAAGRLRARPTVQAAPRVEVPAPARPLTKAA